MSTAPGVASTAPPSAAADGGVRISPAARRPLRAVLDQREGPAQAVWIRSGEAGYGLALVDRDAAVGPEWMHGVDGEIVLVWRREAAPVLEWALLDHEDGGFRLRLAPESDEELAALVTRALEEGVNPLVASHGGRVRLVDVDQGVVRVRMEGGCQGCTAARETLTGVVVRHLEHGVPGIHRVDDVTDHAAGTSPFYAPTRDGVVSLPIAPAELLREACG